MAEAFLHELLQTTNSKQSVSNDRNCLFCLNKTGTICQDTGLIEVQLRLPCGHSYGSRCIAAWFKDHNSCPLCKQEFFPAQPGLHLETGPMLEHDVLPGDGESGIIGDPEGRNEYIHGLERDLESFFRGEMDLRIGLQDDSVIRHQSETIDESQNEPIIRRQDEIIDRGQTNPIIRHQNETIDESHNETIIRRQDETLDRGQNDPIIRRQTETIVRSQTDHIIRRENDPITGRQNNSTTPHDDFDFSDIHNETNYWSCHAILVSLFGAFLARDTGPYILGKYLCVSFFFAVYFVPLLVISLNYTSFIFLKFSRKMVTKITESFPEIVRKIKESFVEMVTKMTRSSVEMVEKMIESSVGMVSKMIISFLEKVKKMTESFLETLDKRTTS